MFEVSDKIVCINARGLDELAFLFTELPIEGQMYVVRGMDFHPATLEPDGIPGVLLVGIFGGDWHKTGDEFCFHALRFVKLDEYRKNREHYRTLFGSAAKELPKPEKKEKTEEALVVA